MRNILIISAVLMAAIAQAARADDYLPLGSYQESCTKCSVQRGSLSCMCSTKKGTANSTSIAVTRCTFFANKNGTLTCEQQH